MAKSLKKAKADTKKEMVMEYELVISDSTKFVASLSEFQGRMRVDVRKHIVSTKYTGRTKEGINMTADHLEELYNGLGALLETVKANGWDKNEEVEN